MSKSAYIDSKKTKLLTHEGYIDLNYGKYVKRRSYAKIDRRVEVPNLIAYQQKSYERFLNQGIRKVCEGIFPVIDTKSNIEVHYKGHFFEDGNYDEEQALVENRNYEKRLFLKLDVFWNKKDKHDKDKPTKKIKLNPIPPKSKKKDVENKYTYTNSYYFGSIPIIASKGNFIINGSNKIIIPQILKTPGSYFLKERIGMTYFWWGRIQPFKGNWLDIALRFDYQNTVYPIFLYFDRSKKGKTAKGSRISITTFLRALGVNYKILRSVFGNDPHIEKTFNIDEEKDNLDFSLMKLENLLTRTSKSERFGREKLISIITNILFSDARYSLAKFGRHQINQKQNIFRRLKGNYSYDEIRTIDGKVLVEKDELIDTTTIRKLVENKEKIDFIKRYKLKDGIFQNKIFKFAVVPVYTNQINKEESKFSVVGPDPNSINEKLHFDVVDILSIISYLLSLERTRNDELVDDIDHLENRRVRNIGELTLDQFNDGLLQISKTLRKRLLKWSYEELEKYQLDKGGLKGKESIFTHPMGIGILDTKPLENTIKRFFNTSQLVQFMDQTNPIAELTNKRKITSLGPRGLDRRWSGEKVRDVHFTHYGRICPVETPEGANIGLIHSLPTFTIVDEFGFLKAPYWKVKNGTLFPANDENSIDYLSPNEEYSRNYIIASSNVRVNKDGKIINELLPARKNGENIMVQKKDITHIDVSPRQVLSISSSCIPFVESDDATRVLMASNMQRQAVPLLIPEAPIVGTGMEYVIARDSAAVVTAKHDGEVVYVDASKVIISDGKKKYHHHLSVFENSNQGTSTRHHPIVFVGDKVIKGDILADGSATDKGELALGKNVLVAFTTWYGYNFEDAVVISKRLVKDDVYTSVHVIEYTVECHDTKNGSDEFTRDIPYTSELATSNLDENGIITIGTEVNEGDILVGKTTPYVKNELTSQQELVFALFNQKPRNVKDASLRVPNGISGIVQKVIHLKNTTSSGTKIRQKTKDEPQWRNVQVFENFETKGTVREIIKVYLIQKRKIQEGDKMAGRHGNKGVVSIIVPEEDMPFLEDGTPIDILLSPLGIPSRMNIGQVMELHVGYAASKLNIKIATPVFEGMNGDDINELLEEAKLDKSGKVTLYNGLTGEKFTQKVAVGIMYVMKLAHMVDDKIHARSVGPYSLITQQPLGGKSNNGGQRLGEMEVWALEAYGAAYTLKEMLTIKSDDIFGRRKAYNNIINGLDIKDSGTPEALSVLVNEIRGLAINVQLKEEPRIVEKKEEVKVEKLDNYKEKEENNGR